jgi:two-component system chemotaxis sensor kinase CheA
MTSDQSFILEALPAFISEAHEQIEALEQLLLELEDQPDNRELLDALFRCAHTVKGSAGIFGLDRVVAFTHHVETLLDRVREGELALTPELSSLLLQSNDQLRVLVDAAQHPAADNDAAAAAREALVAQLQAAGAAGSAPADDAAADNVSAADAAADAAPTWGQRRWRGQVRFGDDTFRNGMDPLAVLNYLRGLGHIHSIDCDAAHVPALTALNPETCHIGVRFVLDTEANREQIESAFSFVRDDCTLVLNGPEASPKDLASRIDDLPNAPPRLGDILLSVGAISPVQLHQVLRSQEAATAADGQLHPLGEILQNQLGLSPNVVAAALNKQHKQRVAPAQPASTAAPAAHAGDDQRFIRVHADRLDEVINLLGELVIAGAGASMLARGTRQNALIEANQQITRLVEEIRNSTLQLRMVPIGETFARFRRVVRDTAQQLGKDVQFEVVGGDTELDKSVVERIADPLMHLVRNALDHGLETPAQRAATGKTEPARLTLSACHEPGSILIHIRDNGRGIQRERVLQRAWDRGLVERGVVPPDADIDRLIFEPGFSTAETVTNLSGRGVGMDVVRSNIEALRGTVAISSDTGQGTCIEIRLPLTLAIIDGFLIGVGHSKFIFPLESVVEVIESRATETAFDTRGRSCVELRGQVLPVVSLRALYALEAESPERISVVVIQHAGQRFGVMVDVLLGQHQTVIKPLGRMFRSLRGVAGSSILGTGEVALIFDVASLRQLAQQPSRTPAAPFHSAVAAAADHSLATLSLQGH